jgi:hypothetical protein
MLSLINADRFDLEEVEGIRDGVTHFEPFSRVGALFCPNARQRQIQDAIPYRNMPAELVKHLAVIIQTGGSPDIFRECLHDHHRHYRGIGLLFPAPLCDPLHHGRFSHSAGSIQGQDAVTGMLINGIHQQIIHLFQSSMFDLVLL